jgi:KDO2-lipid IV(A) lauroyltransferase
MNLPVVYVLMQKTGRGRYELHAEMLFEHPANLNEEAITEGYVRRLEQDIKAQPETWLWSHKRWKHRRPVTAQSA